MNPVLKILTLALWAVAAAVAPSEAQVGAAAAPDSVRLPEILAEALDRSPRLAAVQAMAEAAGYRTAEAGTLPDPTLAVGAMNLGLPEFDAGMAAAMLPSVQVAQTFPLFGKLGLREEMAEAAARAAATEVEEEAWRIRREVAEHFHALYAVDRILDVHRGTLELLQDVQSVARSLYASGAGRQADVLRADVEVARMDAEIRRLAAIRAGRAAELNAALDRPGRTPVPPTAHPALPSGVPVLDTLLAWAAASRPTLRRQQIELERARAGVALAEREFWPDFTVSAQYGRRGGDDPRSMGGLMIGASLPIHAGARQRPRREAARALERHAVSRDNQTRASVEAELRSALAELDRARGLLGLYRDEILPAARVNVSSSLAAYRVGEVDFATLVDAQLDADRYQEEYIRLVADYGASLARLEAAAGRTIPEDYAAPLPLGSVPEAP